MRRLIATLGPKQSGKFFNYTGREYPWFCSRCVASKRQAVGPFA